MVAQGTLAPLVEVRILPSQFLVFLLSLYGLVEKFSPSFAFLTVVFLSFFPLTLSEIAGLKKDRRTIIIYLIICQILSALAFLRLLKMPFVPKPLPSLSLLIAIAVILPMTKRGENPLLKILVYSCIIVETLSLPKPGISYIFLPFYFLLASLILFNELSYHLRGFAVPERSLMKYRKPMESNKIAEKNGG